MSDPIFQTHTMGSSFIRVTGAFVIAPLLGIAALATFYFLIGWTKDAASLFAMPVSNAVWGYIVFVVMIGLVHAVLMAGLSAAFSKTDKRLAFRMFAISIGIGGLSIFAFALFGGNIITILGSILVLLILAFEMSRMMYSIILPHLKRGKNAA